MQKITTALLFVILQISSFQTANACELKFNDLNQIEKARNFSTDEATPVDFPKELFKSLEATIGHFDDLKCKNAILRKNIRNLKTGAIYTVFYTSEDLCDGGNPYGVIVKGTEAVIQNVESVIIDSSIFCL